MRPKRPAGSLELARQRVALEIHEEDHVVGGGERPSAEVEIREARKAGPHDQHVGIDADDPLDMRGQDFGEEKPAEHRAREAPLAGKLGVIAAKVEGEQGDAIAEAGAAAGRTPA